MDAEYIKVPYTKEKTAVLPFSRENDSCGLVLEECPPIDFV